MIFKSKNKESTQNYLQNGFTLTEIIVAIFVFVVVMGVISVLFTDTIKNQRRALANQELLNQTSYVLEYIGRAIRMAKKDDIDGIDCLSGEAKVNYELTRAGEGIMFRNYKDEYCQEFFRECAGGICRLKERKKEINTGNETEDYLTSDNLDVISFNMGPNTSWSQEDVPPQQPRITLFLDIKRLGFPSGEEPEIKIQTTISQRNLDVKY